ncbi:phytoene/squalene synthase family protein [Marinoscillum sp. MHG1-6]|uniref:phytoene/squalene synthase family protein n=1 Tax=Marinoscillum sp. MHG1-6 TaxID=2959627 RepID=UPI00215703D6|nr:phytoene/squalene synthase family protein [Marinoscillum sp. MHG1-6]
MKALYDQVCLKCSQLTTRSYSTSFSLGIRLLDPSIRSDIYAIYGLVRFADEIVDTFHDYNKKILLARFKADTYEAISEGISLNPILQSFQETINKYQIDPELIESFFNSMEMDLSMETHDEDSYEEYIVGSAEVVGLMCLTVFVNGDKQRYQELKFAAERLGAAFQKVNFLRDLKHDTMNLNRAYFPEIQHAGLTEETKRQIEADIEKDFDDALVGIRQLPLCCRLGVFLAYRYYRSLFNKIRALSAERILTDRIRINNTRKLSIMLKSYLLFNFDRKWSY